MEPRPYLSSSDRAGCLALFDGDQPAEREAFARFLDDCGPSTFTVLEHDGGLVGCGGWTIGTDGAAELVWGTIRRDMRRLGLGRFLLLYRLRKITQSAKDVQFVRARTSPEAAAFFEKQGFKRQPGEPGGAIELVMKLKVCP